MVRILAAGSAVIDFVMHLDALPARPEKYRASGATLAGGGCAATAMVAAARLGAQAMMAGRLGDDPIGQMIRDGLLAEGVDCALLRAIPGRRSSFSTVAVDATGERQIVNYRDPDMPPGADWLAEPALPPFDAALTDTRWPAGAMALMQAARSRGRPGIVDAEAPVAEAAGALALASHVAYSAQGLREHTARHDLAEGLHDAAMHTRAFVCVTDGAAGVYWLQNGEIHHAPAFAVAVRDTLGAGDVWHGAFALALAEGQPEPGAIRFASAAAALKCMRPGGRDGAPTRAELDLFLKETPR